MIEDIELTRKILETYADEDEWPSKIEETDLRRAFPDVRDDILIAHLVWATDAGMFKGKGYYRVELMGGPEYGFGYPDGLSKVGSDYVHSARQSNLWEKGKKQIAEKGLPLSTSVMSRVLAKIIQDFIQ